MAKNYMDYNGLLSPTTLLFIIYSHEKHKISD